MEQDEPIAFRITCCICGRFDIVPPESLWQDHIIMRQHIFGAHQDAEYDIEGKPVHRGYGWTDDYVAVLPIITDMELKRAARRTEEILKGL